MAVMGLPCLYFSCNVASDTRLVDDRVSGTAVSLKYFLRRTRRTALVTYLRRTYI